MKTLKDKAFMDNDYLYVIEVEEVAKAIKELKERIEKKKIMSVDIAVIDIDDLYEDLNEVIGDFSPQLKKDNADSSNENYLETQSRAEEDNKSEHMSVSVDNQVEDKLIKKTTK